MLHKVLTTAILALFVLGQVVASAPQELERSIGDPCALPNFYHAFKNCR